MSLFADKWPSAFDHSFGIDSLHSKSFGRFLREPSLFSDDSDENDLYSKMRIGNTSLFGESGFYDDFDSIFHGLGPLNSRRNFGLSTTTDERSIRRSHATVSAPRGKEYIIPIKLVSSSSSPEGKTSPLRPRKLDDEANLRQNENGDIHSQRERSASRQQGEAAGGRSRVIHIPIVRESLSSARKPRTKSRSPPKFSHIIPTTDEYDRKDSDDDVICLDSDAFFTRSGNKSKYEPSKYDSDIEIMEVDENEGGKTSRSYCRKPLRHECTSSRELTSCFDKGIRSGKRLPGSSGFDVKKNDASQEDEEREREESAAERKRSCAHPGVANVTSPPSYRIYDHLRPRLASIGRQVDYIRGDGNCFFRAISKEMYGSEDYHAEWRQAVCDLIAAHPRVFQQYIDEGSVQQHVDKMRELGTWATTCEIYAASSLLRREIYVLAPTPGGGPDSAEYNWLLFSPRRLTGSSAGTSVSRLATDGEGQSHEDVHPCYLTLCHTNANHYDRIVPVIARCNCEMAPPSLNGVSLLLDLTASDEEDLMQQ